MQRSWIFFQNKVTIAILAVLSSFCQHCPAQPGSSSVKAKVDPTTLARILRLPGGMEKAAGLVGTLVIADSQEFWGSEDLAGLTSKSSLIFVGTVKGIDSRVVTAGEDSMESKYSVYPETWIKGEHSTDVVFFAAGGKVTFPNGASAEVKTLEWEHLKVGDRALFFLTTDNESKKTVSTGGAEGIFPILASETVHGSLAGFDSRSHNIDKEVANSPLNSLTERVSGMIGAQ